MRTKAACASVSARNRAMSPTERTPTIGQKRSSKKKNTLRMPMSALRCATAQTASASARQLNEHLLQLGLPDLRVAHHDALVVEPPQDFRQPLLRLVHRALHPAVALHVAQNPRRLREPGHASRVELQGDDVARPDLALELVRCAARQDPPALDERDLVA